MPLESANYINDLNPNYPISDDDVGEGDNHLRLIKLAIQNTFPNITGTVTASQDEIGLPAGSIIPFAGATPPATYLLCDGSAVSRDTYSRLFTAIGETYGAGDGSTTFNLPDLRLRFPFGAGTDKPLGTKAGKNNPTMTTTSAGGHTHTASTASAGAHNHGGTQGHALTINEMPAHSHATHVTHGDIFDGGPYSKVARYSDSLNGKQTSTVGGTAAHAHGINNDGGHIHSVSVQEAAGHTHSMTINELPQHLALNFLIKT